ncbi:MAG: hypothetical protein ACTHMA_01365 [Thermomicrobiales bacterium]
MSGCTERACPGGWPRRPARPARGYERGARDPQQGVGGGAGRGSAIAAWGRATAAGRLLGQVAVDDQANAPPMRDMARLREAAWESAGV